MQIIRAIVKAIGFFFLSVISCTVLGYVVGGLFVDGNDLFLARPIYGALIGFLIGIIAGGWYAVNKH